VAGNTTVTNPVFSALIATLLGQRRNLECERERRGAVTSPIASWAKTPTKATSGIKGSLETIRSGRSLL
jgi:hypothetical protein